MSVAACQRINGLSEVADRYQGVLLDQFGVLHDGRNPYPGAAEAVRQLAEAGKTLLVLSNSSRRSSGTLGKLAAMGFKEDWFAGAITSGELTHHHLATRPTPFWQQLGQRCIHITWGGRGTISLDGLDLQVVDDPASADFVLVHGTQALGQADGSVSEVAFEALEALLRRCAERGNLPLVVANPDLVTVDGSGGVAVMPGTLARLYQQLGGQVVLMGKPSPLIYAAAQDMLPGISPGQWLAVGDSLEHDIAGAQAAGVAGVFIAGGIHAEELKLAGGPAGPCAACSWDEAALDTLCGAHGVQPAFVLPFMRW